MNAVMALLSFQSPLDLDLGTADLQNSPYFHYTVLKLRSFGIELVSEESICIHRESFFSERGGEFKISETVSISYHCGHSKLIHQNVLDVFKDSSCSRKAKIIAVDSYLNPRIYELIECELSHTNILLCKLLGDTIWIGPFIPKGSHKWKSVLHRVSLNFPIHSQLASRFKVSPVGGWRADFELVRRGAEQLLAVIENSLSASAADTPVIYTLATENTECIPHKYISTLEKPNATKLSECPQVNDGGQRSFTARSIVDHCSPIIDPLLGILPELHSATKPLGVNVCFTQQNFPSPHSIKEARITAKISAAAGKGETRDQAMASCIGEAIERYAAGFQGTEGLVFGSFKDLQSEALDPRSMMLFATEQYENRVEWNRKTGIFQHVPEPFSEDMILGWQRCECVTNGEMRLVPASLVYFRYHDFYPNEPAICIADSNGCASGGTPTEAKLQALYEIIERDACAIWWYNRTKCKSFSREHFSRKFVKDSYLRYASYGRGLHLLDLTSDLQIPVVIAISADTAGSTICVGLGCNSNAEIAASRAVAELDQFVAAVGLENISPTPHTGNIELDVWLKNAVLSQHPYLEPALECSDMSCSRSFNTLNDEFKSVLDRVNRVIGPAYWVDLTRTETPLYVVKLFVPGARHFWARFSAGRLFDVPLKTGALLRRHSISELNPIPFFL